MSTENKEKEWDRLGEEHRAWLFRKLDGVVELAWLRELCIQAKNHLIMALRYHDSELKEAASEHVESPRQNELLPCPHCGKTPTLSSRPGIHHMGRDWSIQCENAGCFNFCTTGSRFKSELIAAWNKRAPLSDDVKAVKKEGGSGLKETSEHSAHVLQNALTKPTEPGWWWLKPHAKAIWEPIRVHRIEGYGGLCVDDEDLGAMPDDTEYRSVTLLDGALWVGPISVPDGTPSIAAPVTPKSEEEDLENEALLASKALPAPRQNTHCELAVATIVRRALEARGVSVDDNVREALREWVHFVKGRSVLLVTDSDNGSDSPKSASVSSPAGSSTKEEEGVGDKRGVT